ncbi:MAG: hypothetical protein QHH01_04170 [Spirochaetales bacterium]|nr:hypothetical protein [Spirochaetales bacterium]
MNQNLQDTVSAASGAPLLRVLVLYGRLCSGKSTAALALAQRLQESGMLCEGLFELSERGKGGIPYRLTMLRFSDRVSIPLGERPPHRTDIPFVFNRQAFQFAAETYSAFRGKVSELLQERDCKHGGDDTHRMTKTVLQHRGALFLDEIGQLELRAKEGFLAVVQKALEDNHVLLVLTVRDQLLPALQDLLHGAGIPDASIEIHDVSDLRNGETFALLANRLATLAA